MEHFIRAWILVNLAAAIIILCSIGMDVKKMPDLKENLQTVALPFFICVNVVALVVGLVSCVF